MQESKEEITFRGGAVTIIVVILIAFIGVTIHSSLLAARRSQLEETSQVTAVGDKAWFPAPAAGPPTEPKAAVTYQGSALIPVSYRRIDLRETRMIRAGVDDSGQYSVYVTREIAPAQGAEAERRGAPVYFLKTGLGEFIKVQPSGSPGHD